VKGLKTTLVVAIAIGLLAGSAIGVAAQDEVAPPVAPGTFTADAVLQGEYVEVGCDFSDGVESCRDECQMAVDATDPRASGTLTYGLNRDTHSGVSVRAGTVTIENDDGMWAGTFTC
jgi:hypothetical protein